MHHPTDRITHTTAFVTPVVEHWLEREIAQWVHPMKDRSDDQSHHERTLYLRTLNKYGHGNTLSNSPSMSTKKGARCSSVVRAVTFAYGAMCRLIDPSRSSQCSTTGVTKAVVYDIQSVV